MNENGPSRLLMRGNAISYIQRSIDPLQLSFWPEEGPLPTVSAPGEDYPWFYHERMQHYMANCIPAAVAAVMAQEDVERKQKNEEREAHKLAPPLWDVA